MIRMMWPLKNKKLFNILCLGAHSDDIEIGCGGSILRLIKEYTNLHFHWIVLGASGTRAEEAIQSANQFLEGTKTKSIIVKGFRDGFFPYIGVEVKEYFEKLKREVNPDMIFTHFRNDLHQDHRLVSELTWNTFRNHLILEYEIPKYDGDLGSPNFFIRLEHAHCKRKIELIMKTFKTQLDKHWLTEDTLKSLLRLRGIESGGASDFSEAFYCRKLVF